MITTMRSSRTTIKMNTKVRVSGKTNMSTITTMEIRSTTPIATKTTTKPTLGEEVIMRGGR